MRKLLLPLFACLALAGCTSSIPFSNRASGQTCSYNQQTYKAGESFPSTDGCNTCSCSETGAIACTLRFCAPQPVAQCQTAADCEGNAIDTSFCSNGSWNCVDNQCELSCDISDKL